MIFGLEGMVEGNDEGMVACRKNFLFRKGTFDFVAFDHFLLAQD
jgi:hypothetical protein